MNRFAALPKEKIAAMVLVLILALAGYLYSPGLSGGFLLDDDPNLKGLASFSKPVQLKNLAGYVLTGISGPSGRPLSMLSFAAQHDAWPANPFAFKLVNLLLHLINGVLVYWFLLKLSTHLTLPRQTGHVICLFSSAVWLLHPMQVSTVLYVIQRMTELCALFTLSGLIAYVYGRERLLQSESRPGYVWLTAGVVLGGLLATLSKENGVLLLVFVLVLESTLFSRLPKPRYWRQWSALFLYAPLILLTVYFLVNQDNILTGYQQRGFDMMQRLLTETRILLDYIVKLFVPRPRAFGLLFDDYPVSHSLLEPPITLLSAFIIAGLIGAAITFRKSQPLFAFAVLWFFGGHLLESTFIPLELYYEHRNYLPILGLIFATASYTVLAGPRLQRFALPAGMGMLALFVVITWNESQLWSNPFRQGATWASERPLSNRAQDYLGNLLTLGKDYSGAINVYQRMTETHPDDARGFMRWIALTCENAELPLPDMETVIGRLKISEFSYVPPGLLMDIVESHEKKKCLNLRYQDLQRMLNALLQNPKFVLVRNVLYATQARLYATQGLLDPAMEAMDKAYAAKPEVEYALAQVYWLATAGLYDDALKHLQKAREAADRGLLSKWLNRDAINLWERALLEAQKEATLNTGGQ